MEKKAVTVTVLIWLTSLSFWAGALWADLNSTANAVEQLEQADIHYRQIIMGRLMDINQRLSRIEGSLGIPSRTPK